MAMKKFLFALAIMAMASGCAVRTSRGTHFFFQRGVVLQLTHTCTDRALVYHAGRGLVSEAVGATPVDIPLDPTVFGEQTISVTVQSINAAGRVVATFTQQFYIDSRSTTTQTWVIGGNGWSGGGRQSYCPTSYSMTDQLHLWWVNLWHET